MMSSPRNDSTIESCGQKNRNIPLGTVHKLYLQKNILCINFACKYETAVNIFYEQPLKIFFSRKQKDE